MMMPKGSCSLCDLNMIQLAMVELKCLLIFCWKAQERCTANSTKQQVPRNYKYEVTLVFDDFDQENRRDAAFSCLILARSGSNRKLNLFKKQRIGEERHYLQC